MLGDLDTADAGSGTHRPETSRSGLVSDSSPGCGEAVRRLWPTDQKPQRIGRAQARQGRPCGSDVAVDQNRGGDAAPAETRSTLILNDL